jgi:hypothetical protein
MRFRAVGIVGIMWGKKRNDKSEEVNVGLASSPISRKP